jgi:uncharacterized membrane protein YjgN (DUF898 family)
MSDDLAALKSRGTIVFVLGLLSVVSCQILGPVAIFMGNSYLSACEEAGVEPDGLGKAGRILGIIGTVFFVLSLIFVGLYIAFIAVMIATGALN